MSGSGRESAWIPSVQVHKEHMAMKDVIRRGLALALLLLLAACSSPLPTSTTAAESHGGSVRDHVSLVDYLRGKGFTVEIAGDVQQPFLRPSGTTLRISGAGITQPAEIQSFNYDDTDLGTNG